jgi:hypothetical protein
MRKPGMQGTIDRANKFISLVKTFNSPTTLSAQYLCDEFMEREKPFSFSANYEKGARRTFMYQLEKLGYLKGRVDENEDYSIEFPEVEVPSIAVESALRPPPTAAMLPVSLPTQADFYTREEPLSEEEIAELEQQELPTPPSVVASPGLFSRIKSKLFSFLPVS